MTDAVERKDRGNVAVLRLCNPPVNAISHAVRLGLARHLEQCAADAGIASIVLVGAGGTFPAGGHQGIRHADRGAEPGCRHSNSTRWRRRS